MRYGISTEGDFVSAHFGRCPEFTIVDVDGGRVSAKSIVQNPGHEPGRIPQFLHEHGVNVIVSGGMGRRAQGFFDELGMNAIVGVQGRIDEVITSLCLGTLEGGESSCTPGAGRGYGVEKNVCDHGGEGEHA
jgi:predicted Fe-Mo cluster-binding NifX family protein